MSERSRSLPPSPPYLFVVVLVVSALILTSCTRSRSESSSVSAGSGTIGTPVAVTANGTLTSAERLYGTSATDDPRVRYAASVVLIHRGAAAVKSVASDGVSWTMDGSDPDVAKLRVGSVMLATSLGTGRVAVLHHVGADVLVVLMPVSLTDVVSDADLSSSQPLSLSNPLYYSTPDRPGLVDQKPTPSAGSGSSGASPSAGVDASAAPQSSHQTSSDGSRVLSSGQHAAQQPVLARQLTADQIPKSIPWPVSGSMLPPVTIPTTMDMDKFSGTTICCSGSTGLRFTYDQNGARLLIMWELQADSPTVNFHLKISGSQIDDASVSLNGVAGVKATVEAATEDSAADLVSPSIEVPISVTFPLFGTPIPLTATITQAFNVHLLFGGAALLKTHGSFSVNGNLGFGVTNGSAHADAAAFINADNPLNNMESASIAPSAFVAAWALRASVGIGVQGFTAGVWYQLTAALSIVFNGATGGNILPCKETGIDISNSYGVGYSIPKKVADIVNSFLSLINVTPIAASSGKQWGPNRLWHIPLTQQCGTTLPSGL